MKHKFLSSTLFFISNLTLKSQEILFPGLKGDSLISEIKKYYTPKNVLPYDLARTKLPSIDVAAKLDDTLGVTIDYLLGKSDSVILDKKSLLRLEDIEQLPEEDKSNIFYTIDNLIKAAKMKHIAAL